MLKISNLSFAYPDFYVPVVNNVNLDIEAGHVYGLLGPNGTGKSTLLYLIAGLLTPLTGEVTFDGVDTRRRLPATLQDIFIVPEEFDLPPLKLMDYAKHLGKFYPRFSYDDLMRHLQTFGMDANIFLGALSMGQKKKAHMCLALATNTRLLLLDEPTNGLDIPGKASFRRFISSCIDGERSIIISTHQVHDIQHLLDHIIIMNQNSILLNRSVQEITQRLWFGITTDPQVAINALYAQPTIMGSEIVTPNYSGQETDINLETLFLLAATRPNDVYNIFNAPQQ